MFIMKPYDMASIIANENVYNIFKNFQKKYKNIIEKNKLKDSLKNI